jgi:hypothetical protein
MGPNALLHEERCLLLTGGSLVLPALRHPWRALVSAHQWLASLTHSYPPLPKDKNVVFRLPVAR